MTMAAHALDPLFRPRSVAVIGASNDPNKIGGRPIAFLKRAGYAGAILPVNPGSDANASVWDDKVGLLR